MIICTTANYYAKIKAFQTSLFSDDAFFRKGAEFFAESRDLAGFGCYTLWLSMFRKEVVFMAFSIHDSETAFRKATAEGVQGLWHTMVDAFHRVDAAMRFTVTPITSGRVV